MGDYIMRIDGQTVKSASINGSDIKEIRNATTQVVLWRKPAPNYLYFEDRSGETNSISITKTGDQAEWLSLEYSTDKNTWTTWDFAQTLTLPANGRVYLRGNNTYGFGFNAANYHTFDCTGNYALGGNIWSVMSDNVPIISGRFMSRTFQNSSTLVDCSQLSIPELPMDSVAFTWTFASCPNLVSVMESIPSTYYYGESGSDNSHFHQMFIGNLSQTNFPVFPNITYLKKSCMNNILSSTTPFNQALEYVDLSNIETVYTQGLYGAFYNCKSLEVAKIGISAWGDYEDSTSDYFNNTLNWLAGVHSTGVFCKNATLPVTRGVSYIPNNWSIADLNGKLYAPVITNTNNTITIAEAEGGASCQIFYTVDGTTPTPENGTLYTQPFIVSSGTTVRAIAHYNGAGSAYVSDSDYAEVVTGAITVYGYPFGDNRESGNNLRDNTLYFCVGTPDDGEHYYIMKNSNWSTNVYNGQTSYYDTGTPVTVGTDINGRLYIASTEISNPTKYRHQLTRNSGQGIGHFIGALQYNPSDTPDPGTRLWEDPNVYERDKGMWMPSANGATWYTGYRLKYGPVTHGSNYLGKCFYLSTDTTNDYSVMFFRADTQVIYINN